MGCFNAIYLIPVYNYAEKTDYNAQITDNLDKISIANMNKDDGGMYGTVIASYLVFGYTMFLVLQEFDWYISTRHQLMSRNSPQNYTIFIGGIPHELRSNKALCHFFNQLFDDVDDVNIALRIAHLDELTKKADNLELKLEHAVNVFTATGKRPTHSDRMLFGEGVDSIDTFHDALSQARADIATATAHLESDYAKHENTVSGIPMQPPPATPASAGAPPPPPLALDGAFVTFHSLRSASAAQQALLHPAPFGLWAVDAPLPQHVCWANVGRSHAAVQLGTLASGALTTALCVLWTVPVAIVASFSRIDSLKRTFPFLQAASDASPIFDQVLA